MNYTPEFIRQTLLELANTVWKPQYWRDNSGWDYYNNTVDFAQQQCEIIVFVALTGVCVYIDSKLVYSRNWQGQESLSQHYIIKLLEHAGVDHC